MRHHGLGGLRSPSLQYSPISSVATSWAGSSQISDLHLQSPISNVVILGRIQSDLRSPSPISNLQSRFGGPGEGGAQTIKEMRMDSFTMQKDLHPLFAPFCNLQSAHTISRRLLARSQNLHLCRKISQARLHAPTRHLRLLSSIYTGEDLPPLVLQSTACSWQEICHL